MSINDITKDEIKSKPNNELFRDNYDKIRWEVTKERQGEYIKSLQNQVK